MDLPTITATVTYNGSSSSKPMTASTRLNVYRGMTFYAHFEPNLMPNFNGNVTVSLAVTSYTPSGTPLVTKKVTAKLPVPTNATNCHQITKYVNATYGNSSSLQLVLTPMQMFSKFTQPCDKSLNLWKAQMNFTTDF